MLSFFEKRYAEYLALGADRIRASFLRTRGASLGAKSRIGKHCIVQRPWCLTTGDRIQFEPRVYIKITGDEARINLGREVFIGYAAELDISRELWIGNHVLIAPGCFITDHNHRRGPDAIIATQGCECASVRIGDDVWLGAHAVILPGVTIGNGAIVAANAVVNRDIAPMSIVAGVPARPIGARS
jgi:acetyltransferase-like isoleucine patch superfamily enzyme